MGYQYNEEKPFSEVISGYNARIESVYFPWVDLPRDRSMIAGFDSYYDYGLQEALTVAY